MSHDDRMAFSLDNLPVELVADILSELDLASLIIISGLSRRLRAVATDGSLNPWRKSMLNGLELETPDSNLINLSVRNIVPHQNWVEVFTRAKPDWILYQITLPNLKDNDWEECFSRRFLPGWKKWKKEERWRQAFLATLSMVLHRRKTRCTADEAWTSYIVLNRNGSANQLESSSRNFNPIGLFNVIKSQTDLLHLETYIRILVQLADVRILALGVQRKPRTSFQINSNAAYLFHPVDAPLRKIHHPTPAPAFENYPNYTPGGQDKRWTSMGPLEEGGGHIWVGSLMLVAQLISPTFDDGEEDINLVTGPGHSQYASFTWSDLWAIAPWMTERINKRIDGPGLGLD